MANTKDFLDFAGTMNKNAEVDKPMEEVAAAGGTNPVVQPGAVTAGNAVPPINTVTPGAVTPTYTPTQVIGDTTVFGATVQSFTDTMNASADGQPSTYMTPQNSLNQVTEPEQRPNNGTDTSDEQTTPGTVSKKEVTNGVDIGESVTQQEGGVVTEPTNTLTATGDVGETIETPTAAEKFVNDQSVQINNQVSETVDTGKMDYDTWASTYVGDTELAFQNARAQLEYEMATWAQNYGANAERLAQMGLSNSGVSDIFGVSAYSAYVSAMNDLYLSKIETDRQNRLLYQQYSDAFDAELEAKNKQHASDVTNAFNYGLSLYDGKNIDAVKTMLQGQGYSEQAVKEAIAKLSAVDATMIPKLQADIEKGKQARVDAFNSYMGSYTTETADSIRASLIANEMSEEDADSVIADLEAFYSSLPDSIKNAESLERISNVVSSYKDSYFKDDRGRIEAILRGIDYSEEEIKAALDRLDAIYDATPENQRPDVVAKKNEENAKAEAFNKNVVTGYNSVLTSGLYDGKNSESVRIQLLNQNYTEEEVNEIISRLEKLDKSAFANKKVMDQYAVIVEELGETFTGTKTQRQHVKQMLKSMGIFDKETFKQAWTLAKSGYAVTKETIAAAEGKEKETRINNAYLSYVGSYTPEMSNYISSMLTGSGTMDAEDAAEVIARLKASYNALPESVKNAESMETITNLYNAYKGVYYPGMDATIKADLANQGMSEDEINAVIDRLGTYYNALPEDQRPDVMAKADTDAAFESNVVSGYSAVLNAGWYNGANGDEVKTKLMNLGYKEDAANEIVSRLDKLNKDSFKNEQTLKAYEILSGISNFTGSQEQKELYKKLVKVAGIDNAQAIASAWGLALAGVNRSDKVVDMFNQLTATADGYDPDNELQLRMKLGVNGWDKKDIDTLVGYLNEFYGAGKTTGSDDEVTLGVNAVTDALFADEPYTGTETQKTQIKQALAGTELADQADEIIEQMDENLGELKQASATDLTNKVDSLTVGSASVSDIGAVLGDTESLYGKDSEEYKQVATKVSNKTRDTILWAFEANPDGTAKRLSSSAVANALGFDADEWSEMDDAEREYEIMERAGELRESGNLTASDYQKIVKSWLEPELDHIINTDNKNLKATGLRTSGAVAEDLKSWRDRGYMTEEEYNKQLQYVVTKMGFVMSASGKISWYNSVKGAEASIQFDGLNTADYVKDQSTIDALEKAANGAYACYNGKIYHRYMRNSQMRWVECRPDMLYVYGDGAINNDEQKEGIYEILVSLLGKKTQATQNVGNMISGLVKPVIGAVQDAIESGKLTGSGKTSNNTVNNTESNGTSKIE